ncbi:MAG: S9 family peptidase [Chitinophagaceae bacterium]|nr:MAG: S9 family peptidase [Chitinophagaceae bacterium]
MIKTAFIICSALCLTMATSVAQDAGGYKKPPKALEEILMAKPTPGVSIDDKGEWMLFTEFNPYPTVEELARPEYRIAGLRINPNNFAPSRQTFINKVYLKNISSDRALPITGLPTPLSGGNVSWSPDDKKIAITHTTGSRVDLYVITVATQKAVKINKLALNTVVGDITWFDNNTLYYNAAPQSAASAPPKPLAPKGPAIQENYGKASPRPTFQDMIKGPGDESLFAFYATTQLVKNVGGVETKVGQPAIYNYYNFSPDKKYILQATIQKPFSYLVPYNGFPSIVKITDINGKEIKKLATIPSSETAPGGNDNVQLVPRGYSWRNDEPATLIWCEALDSGMIKKTAAFRDAVYALPAPFNGTAKELFKTTMRYYGVIWGDNTHALVTEGLRGKQTTQTNLYNPSTGKLDKLMSRNTTDAYTNPGAPITIPNQFGKYVLQMGKDGQTIFYNNTSGSSPKGDLPFLLSYNLSSKKADTLWRAAEGTYETVVKLLDADNLSLVTRRESKSDMPNYWLKNLKLRIADRKLTDFKNPYPQMEGITKEKVRYKRADGVDLTGDLYLPKDYNKEKDGPLPVLLWAYPAEFNSAADAAQIRGSEHRFILLSGPSPLSLVTQGYAVLNNAEFPIVSTDKEKKPNDNFVDQLRMNAEAAINYLSERGVGDRNRMAVSGHSYGAFMTANLLAHTNLFKAGIARSGAYNRSLTPFGFQNEDRTYWEATNLYNEMSPFNYADKIKTPLLLIHGDADNNTGTFPIQSERLFNAIKGHGGTVRYVSLPFESHGYAAQENILHVLAEQYEWLEKYVKNAK